MNNDITQHLSLELSRETSKSSLSVKKNDTNSRRVQTVITNNGGMVKLNQVVMAIVKGTKPDGTTFWNDCTVNGDTIYFIITNQMINVTGDVTCEIEITWLDESQITTPTFNIHVYDSMNTGVESQNEYNGIIQALAETINNRTMAQTAAANAAASASAALVSENNAKASEITAGNSATTAKGYMDITKDYRDYTKGYIDAFIEEQEEDNKTLKLANAYTNEQINDVRGETGRSENLRTEIKTNMVAAINSVYDMAVGHNQAVSYGSYHNMVNAVNNLAANVYNIGQNLYIGTVGVPDLWIFSKVGESVPYTYSTDEAMVNEIKARGYVQVGFYLIAMLETQKVDLTDIEGDIAKIKAAMHYPS